MNEKQEVPNESPAASPSPDGKPAHPGQVVRVADLLKALEDVKEHVGERSQAFFAIEALIKACKG